MPASGSGAKTELVTIERETRIPDGGGGWRHVWTQVGQIYAAAQWVRGGESDRQGALRELAAYRFVVLSADLEALGVTTKDRLVWNAETYNIRERPRRLPRQVESEIIAETGVTQ